MDKDFISIPKVELHHHLDGAFRPASLYVEAKRRNLPQAKLSEMEFLNHCRVSPDCRSLTEFLAVFELFYDIAADLDFLRRAAGEVAEDLKKDGVVYAETRFAPHLFVSDKVGVRDVLEAVLDGLRTAEDRGGIPVRLIACVMRGSDPANLMELVELFPVYHEAGLVGLDLAGDESRFPGDEYKDAFDRAFLDGIPVTVHAGEAAGPESVWRALRGFHARRIGHGIRSMDDPRIIEYLIENDILLEICLTSNLQTGTVPDLQSHPLPKFLEAGVPVALCTDDPSVSGITLSGELEVASQEFSISTEQLQKIQGDALQHAFCSENLKQTILSAL